MKALKTTFKDPKTGYIFLDKQTGSGLIFKTVTGLHRKTKVDYEFLFNIFSRCKLNELETKEYRIIKTKIEH